MAASLEAAQSQVAAKVDDINIGDLMLMDYEITGIKDAGDGQYTVSLNLSCHFDVDVEAEHEGDAQREAWDAYDAINVGVLKNSQASVYKAVETEEEMAEYA